MFGKKLGSSLMTKSPSFLASSASPVVGVCLYLFISGIVTIACFPDNSTGKIIRSEIIPGIAHLRQRFPLSLGNIFPEDFLAAGHFGQKFDCTDLNLNDEIFARYSVVKYVIPDTSLLMF